MEKEINYLDFLEKIKGKSVDEVKTLVIQNNIIANDIEVIDVYDALQNLELKLQASMETDNIQSIFVRKIFIYYSILERFTNINVASEEKVIENLNIYLELVLISLSDKIYLFSEMAKEIIVEERFKIIKELTGMFNEGLPSVDDIQTLQTSLENMFKDESPEKLEKIESILSFNDPVMKGVRDILVNPQIQEKVSDNNGGDNNS